MNDKRPWSEYCSIGPLGIADTGSAERYAKEETRFLYADEQSTLPDRFQSYELAYVESSGVVIESSLSHTHSFSLFLVFE